ncbi:MAG: arsinothricin resistance N-acetyltransferase ArsN1 family B [Pirellulales bacterium]
MPHLREATEDDAAAIAGIYAPYCETTPITFETESPSAEEIRGRIAKVLPLYPWLVGELDGRVVGYAYATRHRERAAYRWGVDVAIYLDGGCHRRGIGRALYSALLPMLVAQGYYTAYAGITLPNEASAGLHRAMGFEPVGIYHGAGYKMGAWHDVVWLEKQLQPLPPAPAEPISAAQLRESPAWADALRLGESLLQP